jgi:hypothetical protein
MDTSQSPSLTGKTWFVSTQNKSAMFILLLLLFLGQFNIIQQ